MGEGMVGTHYRSDKKNQVLEAKTFLVARAVKLTSQATRGFRSQSEFCNALEQEFLGKNIRFQRFDRRKPGGAKTLPRAGGFIDFICFGSLALSIRVADPYQAQHLIELRTYLREQKLKIGIIVYAAENDLKIERILE